MSIRLDASRLLDRLRNFPGDVEKAADMAMTEAALEAKRSIERNTNRVTGNLHDSIRVEKKGKTTYDVVVGVRYYKWLDKGTGIYGPRRQPIIIEPKTAQALRFTINGKVVFARRAVVKGIKPMNLTSQARADVRTWIRKNLTKDFYRYLRQIR